MKCRTCGTEVMFAPVCPTCGAAVAVGASEPPVARVVATQTSGMAIAGFACAIPIPILGLIFSAIGRNECKRSGGTIQGAGLAVAGMVISIVILSFMVLGVIAAVAIPAFMDYSQKSKTTEAQLELRRMSRGAMWYFNDHGAYPVGNAPLTPATPCCMGPGAKCETTPADWMTPEWQVLDFQIQEPHRYQYSYTSDGRSFHAIAVGDLDCDGVSSTYTLDIDSAGSTRINGPRNPD